ncbi:hypothetical protein GGI42DRAFT_307728 [Trichoderma sp. SZMC 28013]
MELARQIKFANFVPNASPCWLTGLPNRIEGGDWGTEAFPGIFLACSLALQAPCMYGTNKNVPVFSHSVLGPLFHSSCIEMGKGGEEEKGGLRAFFKYDRQPAMLRCESAHPAPKTPSPEDTCPCPMLRTVPYRTQAGRLSKGEFWFLAPGGVCLDGHGLGIATGVGSPA